MEHHIANPVQLMKPGEGLSRYTFAPWVWFSATSQNEQLKKLERSNMNDALRLAESPLDDPLIKKQPQKLLRLVPEEKPCSLAKSAEVLQLEAMIQALRTELLQLQRRLAHHELLLQNSRLREQELRVQLLQRQRQEFPPA